MKMTWEAAAAIAALLLSLYNTLAQRRMRIPRLSVSIGFTEVWKRIAQPPAPARPRGSGFFRVLGAQTKVDGLGVTAVNIGFREIALSEWGIMTWRGHTLYAQTSEALLQPGRAIRRECSFEQAAGSIDKEKMPLLLRGFYKDETGKVYKSWWMRTPAALRE